ncbi:MAG: glutathione S-transferase family protein [Sneathiella sp.]|nr:glutathione S-transferase family protein [Sneathiella sp.]
MLTLHHAKGTRSIRVLWLLEEMGLDYTLNLLKFHPSDLKSEEHRARHPLGRVPVLQDDDVTIYESGAIIEYLLARHGGDSFRPDVSSTEFPLYLQWLHYAEGIVMPPVNTIIVQTQFLSAERQNADVLLMAQKLLGKSLKPVEDELAEKDYLTGSFSGADIMLGSSVYVTESLGALKEGFPNLNAYVTRLKSRPAFAKVIKL